MTHITIKRAKPEQVLEPVAKDNSNYRLDPPEAEPAQPAPVQERNFCERCGKRLGGDGHIHTCTPPAAQRQWVGLTDEDIQKYVESRPYYGYCNTEYREGIEQGAKWARDQITPPAAPVQEPMNGDKVKQLVSKCTHRDVDGNWYVDGVQLVHETCFALDAITRKRPTQLAQPEPVQEPVALTGKQRTLLAQAWAMLEDYAQDQRSHGNDGFADGAEASAHEIKTMLTTPSAAPVQPVTLPTDAQIAATAGRIGGFSDTAALGKQWDDIYLLVRRVLAERTTATPPAAQPAPVQEPVAQAWDEGYRAGIDDERTSEANIGVAGFDAKVEPARNNPYRTTPPAAPVQDEAWKAQQKALAQEALKCATEALADPNSQAMKAVRGYYESAQPEVRRLKPDDTEGGAI